MEHIYVKCQVDANFMLSLNMQFYSVA